jgi:hypothetical protein
LSWKPYSNHRGATLATSEEAKLFGEAAATAKPSDDIVLAYLVELDGPTAE